MHNGALETLGIVHKLAKTLGPETMRTVPMRMAVMWTMVMKTRTVVVAVVMQVATVVVAMVMQAAMVGAMRAANVGSTVTPSEPKTTARLKGASSAQSQKSVANLKLDAPREAILRLLKES